MRKEDRKNKIIQITDEMIGNTHEPIRSSQPNTIILKECILENVTGNNRIFVPKGTIILDTNNRFHGDIEIECKKLVILQTIATKTDEKQVALKNFKVEAETIIFDQSQMLSPEGIKIYAKDNIILQTKVLAMNHAHLKAKKGITIQTSQNQTSIEQCDFKTEQTIKIYNTQGSLKLQGCKLETTKNPSLDSPTINPGITIQADDKNHVLELNETKISTDWLKLHYDQILLIKKTTLTPLPDATQSVGNLTIKNSTPQNIQSKAIFQKTELDDYSTTPSIKEPIKQDPLTKIMKMFISH